MVEVRLEVLVVSLATLLGRTRLDGARDANPIGSAILIDEGQEQIVFLLRPGAAFVLRHNL